MEQLSDGALVVVLQNLQLALDYQHRQVDRGDFDQDKAADVEDYLVKTALVLGIFEDEYKWRVACGAALKPLSELPGIKLSPDQP